MSFFIVKFDSELGSRSDLLYHPKKNRDMFNKDIREAISKAISKESLNDWLIKRKSYVPFKDILIEAVARVYIEQGNTHYEIYHADNTSEGKITKKTCP